MPVLIPQLEPPKDADPVAAATTQLLEQVRAMTEWYTNGDSSPSSLLILLGIDNCKSERRIREPKCNEKEVEGQKGLMESSEALNVIDKILQTRLGLSFPYNQKVYCPLRSYAPRLSL